MEGREKNERGGVLFSLFLLVPPSFLVPSALVVALPPLERQVTVITLQRHHHIQQLRWISPYTQHVVADALFGLCVLLSTLRFFLPPPLLTYLFISLREFWREKSIVMGH